MAYKSRGIKLFEELDVQGLTRDKAIKKAVNEKGIKEMTAAGYYDEWKKSFMNGANCIPKKREPLVEAPAPVKEKKEKNFVDEIIKTYIVVAKDPEEPENDIIIECEDDEDMKIYADKCKAQGYEVKAKEDTITWEEVKERMETKDKPEIILMPVVVSGGYFTYRMDYDGVKIESGLIDAITPDCIAEQEAALEMWKKHYSIEVQ